MWQFFGRKVKKIIIEDNSDTILDNTKKATAFSILIFKKIGKKIIISKIRTISSMRLESTWISIFSLPKKYPLKIEEIEITIDNRDYHQFS